MWCAGLVRSACAVAHDLELRDRLGRIAPGASDVRHDSSYVSVAEHVRERRHTVRARIPRRGRKVAAAQHDANKIRRNVHGYSTIACQRRIRTDCALTAISVALGTLLLVNLGAACTHVFR